jgi:hypothetical protein
MPFKESHPLDNFPHQMRHQKANHHINTDPQYKLAIKKIIGEREKNIDACEQGPPHYLKQPILGKTINFIKHHPKTIKSPLFHICFFDQRRFGCVDWQVF